MTGRVAEKVAVVTGGKQGIGKAIADRLAAEGATVIVGDFVEGRSAGMHADAIQYLPLDVSDETSVRTFVNEVQQKCGRINILINNAGIVVHKLLDEHTVEEFDRQCAVNLRGPFLMAKHVAPIMRAVGSGTIVNIGSVEGYMVNPGHTGYASTKAGVHGLTLGLAVDLGPDGIRCNTVCPGWIDTDLNRAYMEMHPDRQLVEKQLARLHPVGRTGLPSEIANAVLWLASDDSSFVSGQMIAVDGARTKKIPLPALLDQEYQARFA